jgi:hypothetical protein
MRWLIEEYCVVAQTWQREQIAQEICRLIDAGEDPSHIAALEERMMNYARQSEVILAKRALRRIVFGYLVKMPIRAQLILPLVRLASYREARRLGRSMRKWVEVRPISTKPFRR